MTYDELGGSLWIFESSPLLSQNELNIYFAK
jgi:hypothetical protein